MTVRVDYIYEWSMDGQLEFHHESEPDLDQFPAPGDKIGGGYVAAANTCLSLGEGPPYTVEVNLTWGRRVRDPGPDEPVITGADLGSVWEALLETGAKSVRLSAEKLGTRIERYGV